MQKRHRQRFLRKKRCDDAARATRGEGLQTQMHLRDSQQHPGHLDCCSLILIASRPALHKTACTCRMPSLWVERFVSLSCSLSFTRQTSDPSTQSHVIMADPTIDAPEVPILLLGDAEVGKSTFLS